jgi:hypothetical protein
LLQTRIACTQCRKVSIADPLATRNVDARNVDVLQTREAGTRWPKVCIADLFAMPRVDALQTHAA